VGVTLFYKEKRMPQFIVLLTENDHAWKRLPEAQRKQLLEKYFEWVGRLKAADQMRGGEPLAAGGSVLRVVDGKTTESPYSETRDVLTGYFLIEATDLAAATAIARGCPALLHGETVVVRPIADMTSDHAGA
jgi:hypothetical protein